MDQIKAPKNGEINNLKVKKMGIKITEVNY